MLNNNEDTVNNGTAPNNKTSRKHSHKKQKVSYVIDMLWLSKL